MRPGDPIETPLPGVRRAPRRWEVRDAGDPDPLARSLGVDPLVARLLLNRGVSDPAAATRWLHGGLTDLPDPRPMRGMEQAVARVLLALDRHERICVHGDYDVDGCTSVALLVGLLRTLGADVTWYAPHRQRDGYGVALHTVRRLAEQGARLVITCDTGTSASEAIALAASLGIDTVVCDHHAPPEVLPQAAAIVNPRLEGEDAPFADLAAVGVSFMLAVALRAALRERGAFRVAPEPDLRLALDLVALGTVADVVPLRGVNRLLVKAGLKVLAARRRPGLRALMEVSGIKAADAVEAWHLGFRLGPRVNAAGRLAEASAAVDLLLAEGDGRARELAAELDALNRRRQETERRILAEAQGLLAGDPLLDSRRGVVVWGDGWHAGVIGIVAARLCQDLHRPVLAVAMDGDSGTGSGRSIQGVDLLAALHRCAPLLLRFGGHRAAAGLEVARKDLVALRDAFGSEAWEGQDDGAWEPRVRVDAEIDLDAARPDLLSAIEALGPFGAGNPAPVFLARGLRATQVRSLPRDGTRMDLRQGRGSARPAIGFGLDLPPGLLDGPIDVLFGLQSNTWQGTTCLEMSIKDVRPA